MDLAYAALVDLVEGAIRYVDNRYGRALAWTVSILGGAVLIAVPLGIFLWLAR